MKKLYTVAAKANPLSFVIQSSKRSVSLAPREQLNPPLTESEFSSDEIKNGLKNNLLKLVSVSQTK